MASLREVAPMLGSSNGHLFTSFELQITSCGTPVPNRDSCRSGLVLASPSDETASDFVQSLQRVALARERPW
ncbi:hypothetical protein IGI04_037062 [Brassica rapa subsp. trilocularis]|uniref:Uncharacterized protein n=1 Tax=Brassica rapa subsp. trilocularis TaxID=1813537 RepID=A0ABQ7LG87_BRACM|nr:hypothetical protein IGI04_037062 [Brassica rapa subsp. trilocularis]